MARAALLCVTATITSVSHAGDVEPQANGESMLKGDKWSIDRFCDDCIEPQPAVGRVFERAVIDPAALPEGSVPAPLVPPEADKSSNATAMPSPKPGRTKSARRPPPRQAQGLELDATKADLATFLRKGSVEAVSARLRPADRATTVLSGVRNGSLFAADSDGAIAVICGSSGEVPLRWQTFRFTPDGSRAEVEIDDGWFDQRTCSSRLERTTLVPAAVVVRHEDRPVLFGLRQRGSLVLMTAPGAAAAANSFDDGGMVAESTALVGLPWGPGRSSAATFQLARETGAGTQREDQPRTLSVEVSQTVTENAPTVLVQLASADVSNVSRLRMRHKIMLRDRLMLR